jgi:trehalose 6-phosphate synthase
MPKRPVVIASNRGPISFRAVEDDSFESVRGAGGLVTAVSAVARDGNLTWVACALSDDDRAWAEEFPQATEIDETRLRLISPVPDAYHGYYNVISNPLLWFLQHAMWDSPRAPNIDSDTWDAWDNGYVAVNRGMAEAVAEEVQALDQMPVVMLQDYQLYLCGGFLRSLVGEEVPIQHFVHIPWPGPTHWTFLPPRMRQAIFRSLCKVDLLGFQTNKDGLNFLRCCQSHLPDAQVAYGRGQVVLEGRTTRVNSYPISVDVAGLEELVATSEAVAGYTAQFRRHSGTMQLILRIDRAEPSKNIIRGFQAFELMLNRYPEHIGRVQFLGLLVPSRLEVEEYRDYLDEVMAAVGWINAAYGDGEWEPVRLLVGDNYSRAVATLRLYDVLLVNPVLDGMNLVAKEGAVVNETDGVLVLSEGAGAHEQLHSAALSVSAFDLVDQADALHEALNMPIQERRKRAKELRDIVVAHDVNEWFRRQLEDAETLLEAKG